jgi:hypothetical protein
MNFAGLLLVAARGSALPVSYRELVALTGIESGRYRFSPFQPVSFLLFSMHVIRSVAACFIL